MSSIFAQAVARRTIAYDEHDEAWFDHAPDEPDHPVEVDPLPSLRDAFVDAVQADLIEAPHLTRKRWVRKWIARNAAGGCMYCGHAMAVGDLDTGSTLEESHNPPSPLSSIIRACAVCLSGTSVEVERAWLALWNPLHPDGLTAKRRRAFMDTLVPLSAGGTSHLSNLALACTTCYAENGDRDWLSFGKAVDAPAFVANRREALRDAANHVLPLTVKGTRAARAVLTSRWAHPRFRAFAGVFDTCGFFAWDTRTLPPGRSGEVLLSLRFGFGATVTNDGEHLVVVEVPRDAWHDAAWMLVEENVLLHRVELSGRAAVVYREFRPSLPEEHKERWWVVLSGKRWEREARRVKRWSDRAHVLQRDLESEELRGASRAPVQEVVSAALNRIDAMFAEVMPC